MAEACNYILIGDSHTTSLKQGFDGNGLASLALTISGNHWHGGLVGWDDERGLTSPNAGVAAQIATATERAGGSLFDGRPIIASVGFHLGRLAPPYGFRGHVADRVDFVADDSSIFTSGAFLKAYVRQHRHFLMKILRKINRLAPLIVVAPPDVRAAPNYNAMRRCVVEMIRESAIAVYDPCERGTFSMLRPLSDDYLAEDKVHGNARYGTELVAEMLAAGVIPDLRAQAAE